MGILGDSEEREAIEERTLSYKHNAGSIDLLLNLYTRCIQKIIDGRPAPYDWREVADEELSTYHPTNYAIHGLTQRIMEHRIEVFYESGTRWTGYEGMFVSACMQRAYDCGENQFTLDISSWDEDELFVAYGLKGTQQSPLQFTFIGNSRAHSLREMNFCEIHLYGDVRGDENCDHLRNTSLHIYGLVESLTLYGHRNSDIYVHKPHSIGRIQLGNSRDIRLHIPLAKDIDLWRESFASYDEYYECDSGNQVVLLEDTNGNT